MKKQLKRVFWGATTSLAIVAGAGAYFLLPTGAADNGGEIAPRAQAVAVVLTPLEEHDFEHRLAVQGNVQAKHFALISARTPGIVDQIFVEEGDRVEAGETVLFQVDPLKLQKALDVARQNLAIARCGLDEKQAYLERLMADFEKARIDYDRARLLYENNSISVDALEQQRTRFLQARAMCKHGQSLVELAREQVDQAQAGLAIADKDLNDSRVVSTLTGTVSRRVLEPGEMADAGTPVLRVEDTSILEVSAFLPAQFYAAVRPGGTRARIRVYDIDAGEHTITFKSPAINPAIRTFEVKCELAHPPDGVVAGAIADIEVVLERARGLGVPAAAVQQRAGNPVVFTVEGEAARMVPVETGFETGGLVEVHGEDLRPGMPVVTMGQFMLNDGTAVIVRGEAR
jgi:RND family efflux transporter MFP subunit